MSANLLGSGYTTGTDASGDCDLSGALSGSGSGLANTTGATFLVAWLSYDSASPPTISDSKSNTWVGLTAQAQGTMRVKCYYVATPTVGTNHNVTINGVLSPSSLIAFKFMWFDGFTFSGTAPLENGASTASASTLAPGNISPAVGDLFLTSIVVDNITVSTMAVSGGGATKVGTDLPGDGAWDHGNYTAWGICASAPVNPTWTWTTAAAAAVRSVSFAPASLGGTTKYVATTGSDSTGTGAIGAPWRTFAFAGPRLSAGSTLYIRGGAYTETLDGSLFPSGTDFLTGAVTISGYPAETVTITPSDWTSGIKITAARSYQIYQDLILDGINQTVGGEQTGGGPGVELIYLNGGATHNRFLRIEVKRNAGNGITISEHNGSADYNEIISCTLHDNGRPGTPPLDYRNRGYGVYLTSNNNLIESCDIYGNNGYGVHINSGMAGVGNSNVIRKNTIHGNYVQGGNSAGGGSTSFAVAVLWGDSNQIYNNLIYGNQGGVEVYSGSTNTQVYNNTITGNTAFDAGGAGGVYLQYYFSAPIIRNNIVYNNGSNYTPIFDAAGGFGTPVIDHNFTTDPSFINAAANNYQLQLGSAAIDAGVTVAAVTTDYAGVARPQGSAYDIGAYEKTSGAGMTGPGAVAFRVPALAATGAVGLLGLSGVAFRPPVLAAVGTVVFGSPPPVEATGGVAKLLPARSGIARSGRSRSGYLGPIVPLGIALDAVIKASGILIESFSISLALNEERGSCRFTMEPDPSGTAVIHRDPATGTLTVMPVPSVGTTIVVELGGTGNRIFAGQISRITRRRRVMPSAQQTSFVDVECVDRSDLFDRRLITTEFAAQSASTIAQRLIAEWTTGFTARNVALGLPTVGPFPCINEPPMTALRRLVNLLGGGGVYIDAYNDVHLFPVTGETGPDAPSNPVSLSNVLATLHGFSYTIERSQLRNRVTVEGQATTCPIAMDAGATTFPVLDTAPFPSYGPVRVGTEVVTLTSLVTIDLVLYIGYVHGGAVGATSLTITYGDAPGSFFQSGWLKVGDQYLTWTGVTGTGPSFTLTGIPASGMGSVKMAIDSLALFHFSNWMTCSALASDHPADTDVVVLAVANDVASQAVLAGLEGGDGVHEFVITDSTLDYLQALALAQQEVARFGSPTGLVSLEFDTDDMNAKIGASQAVNFTAPDPVSVLLTITHVDLTWPVKNRRPMRHCLASLVILPTTSDLIFDRVDNPGLFF